MKQKIFLGSLMIVFLLSGPAMSADPGRSTPPISDELVDAWERFQQVLQEWGGRVRDRFVGQESREGRPLITIILNNRERLGLSADQMRKLEQLRDGFQRQSIRNDSELRIVELDISGLLDNEPVEMAKLESKVREAEKLRADLRLARIRAIEQAKALLTAEQRKKLAELTPEPRSDRPPRGSSNPPAKE
jgi:hypothetical protein